MQYGSSHHTVPTRTLFQMGKLASVKTNLQEMPGMREAVAVVMFVEKLHCLRMIREIRNPPKINGA